MDENRIVLIKGSNSEWYDQVIFVLKHANAAAKKDLVQEAEKILNQYMATARQKYRSSIEARPSAAPKAPTAAPKAGSTTPAKAAPAPRRKYDKLSFFIDLALVVVSTYLGFVLNQMLYP